MAFTLFSQLPLELRLKIWHSALPGPRDICVSHRLTAYRPKVTYSWITAKPAPAILHTCQESREEGLKHYQLAFANANSPATIYFDFSRDTLVFSNEDDDSPTAFGDSLGPAGYVLDVMLSGDYGAAGLEKVRHLRFDMEDAIYDRSNFCWDDIRDMPSLEQVTLICWEQDPSDQVLVLRACKVRFDAVRNVHPEWKTPHVIFRSNLTKKTLWEH